MARPSKLTDKQWEEVLRLHTQGATAAELGKRFKMDPTQISRRVSQAAKQIKSVAALVATGELALEKLPISQQGFARTMADAMKGINAHALQGAEDGMEASSKLLAMVNQRASKLSQDCDTEALRPIVALAETANKAAALGLGLMQANKGNQDAAPKDLEPFILRRPNG